MTPSHLDSPTPAVSPARAVTPLGGWARQAAECRQSLLAEVLQILQEPAGLSGSMARLLDAVRRGVGCQAVALRLQQGEDFPYLVHHGLDESFMAAGNTLVTRRADGEVCREADGRPSLECACGLVLSGRTDPASPFCTARGSFWINDPALLCDLPPEADLRVLSRNHCFEAGFCSVALVPVRTGGRIVGLLQCNDRRRGWFTLEAIHLLESLADGIGLALARQQAEAQWQRVEQRHRAILRNDMDGFTHTERVMADESLDELRRALFHMERVQSMGALASSLAHEVSQPLAGILGNAQAAQLLLEQAPPDMAQVREILADIVADGKRAGAVVGQIRDMLRKAPARAEPFCMNEAVREMETIARASVRAAGVRLCFEPAAGTATVRGDKTQIQQVILNLLLNAAQAMQAAPGEEPQVCVTVEAQEEPRQVVVAVCDRGPGLAREVMRHLFDPFFTTKPDGLGLGLTICRSIVAAHGGRIWAENNPDRGATFRFALPMAGA